MRRYFAREASGINEEEFANWQNPIVHYSGSGNPSESVMPIEVHALAPVYLNMLEYLSNALYTTDEQLYFSEIARLSIQALDDIKASNEVTKAHKESWIRKLSDRLNDTYLKANGTEGVVTYGYVVRLAVGYIRTIEE